MVEELKKIFDNLSSKISLDFVREHTINLDNWPVVLVGERGIWKTYLLLQILKKSSEKSFYFSADNPIFAWESFFTLVSKLYFDYQIRILAIDEIHKGNEWKANLKSIIDSFPDLKLIVSGSSSLDLYKWTSDLQRRIYKVDFFGLSFREFLIYEKNIEVPKMSFEDLIINYKNISFELSSKISLEDFKNYLKYGFYPYFKERKEIYHSLLLNNIKKVILEDLPTFMNLQTSSLSKLEKLFYFVAKNQPSEMNYKSLAEKINISKDLLESIIYYLDQIWVLSIAVRSNKLNDIIRKEFKVFLWNSNIYYAFWNDVKIWTIRESFVLNALKRVSKNQIIHNDIILPNYWDFIFKHNDKNYLFEVGWHTKTNTQIQWVSNSFLVKDDILIWTDNEIPLWMFGLL